MKKNDNLNTPDYIFEQLDEIYGFDADFASSSDNAKVSHNAFCDDKIRCDGSGLLVNALDMSWKNYKGYCNPPFSEKEQWLEKAVHEVENNGCKLCVMVLPLNCMSASAFQNYVIKKNYYYEIPEGRISFLNNATKIPLTGNNTGTVIVYFRAGIKIRKGRKKLEVSTS